MKKKKPDGSVVKVKIVLSDGKEASAASAAVIRERMVEIVLNGRRVVSVACTGEHLEELAAGFLRSEGVVEDRGDILDLGVTADGSRVEVRVAAGKGRRVLGKKAGRTLASSGARGVIAYDDAGTGLKRKISDGVVLTPRNVLRLMSGLLRSAELHDATRGTHCSALATPQKIIVAREDIGRHNTLDMLSGYALLKGRPPEDKVILTTGRVSAEIIHKIRTIGVSVIISHSAPTSRAVALAEEFGITLIGYVRNGKMRIYAHPERVRF
jgi:FdhD protein